MATLVWIEGWEHGVVPTPISQPSTGLGDFIGAAAGSTITADTAIKRSGAYSLKMTKGNSTGDTAYWQKLSLGTGGISVCRFAYYVDSFPNSGVDTHILDLYGSDGATILQQIGYNASGVLYWEAKKGSDRRTGPTLATGRWYVIECKGDTSGTTWTLDMIVDGTTGGSQSSVGSQSANTTTRGFALQLGPAGAGSCFGAVSHFDDLVFSVTAADYPLGDGQVLGIAVDQTLAAEHQSITATEWDYTDNFSSFTNFASSTETDSRSRLNDLNTTTGIRMNKGAAGQAGNARWSLADPSPDPNTVPDGVRVVFSGREASAGTDNAVVRLLLGASTTNVFSGDPGWGTTWNYVGGIVARPGGGAYSAQDIRDLKLEIDSTDSAPNIWIGGVITEVSFPYVKQRDPMIAPSVPVLSRASW